MSLFLKIENPYCHWHNNEQQKKQKITFLNKRWRKYSQYIQYIFGSRSIRTQSIYM